MCARLIPFPPHPSYDIAVSGTGSVYESRGEF